jgi:hypothetical protein
LQIECLRYGLNQQRLRETRYADEHDMTAGKQRRDQIIDHMRLTNNALRDLCAQFVTSLREPFEEREVVAIGSSVAGGRRDGVRRSSHGWLAEGGRRAE